MMKAVIMAGGEGSRLRPLTCSRPKPMVPVANKPVMQHIVELLKKHGFEDIAVTLLYMPEAIKEYFDDGRDYGVNIFYFIEDTPLGTAGSVKNAEEFLDDTFIVISGDALTDADLRKALEFHNAKGSIATLLLKKVDIPLEYGVVVTDDEGRITRFLEKPSWGEVFSDTVNTGMYILSPEVLKLVPKNEMFDFSKDLFPLILKERMPIYGYIIDDYWCDIGDPQAYIQSHIDILNGKVRINIPAKEIEKNIWVGEGTEIDDPSCLRAPCIIGSYSKIKKNSIIGEYSVIGDFNIIGEGTSIKRSIIWNNAIIDEKVEIRGSIICNKVHFSPFSSAFENSVIGDNSCIKENAIIRPNIKIWPEKLISEGAIVNSNLVWGSKFTRNIFGDRGIAGEINTDITPEYASKLGAAYGTLLKGKGKVGVSCDNNPSTKMIKSAFISGLLTTGVEVYDLQVMLLPITRTAVRFYKLDGGIHISSLGTEPYKLLIDVLDKNGCNIDRGTERKIETIFIREDFLRCEGDCIKEVKNINDYSNFYLQTLINSVKDRDLKYRIVLNSTLADTAKVIKYLLSEIGCEVELMDLKIGKSLNKKDSLKDRNVSLFIERVKSGNYDLGVSVDGSSEKMLVLVDDKGRIVTEDMFLALVTIMCMKTYGGGTVVVPLSASFAIEKIASKYGGKVIRSKTSAQDIMYKLIGSKQQEMMDQFTLYFDAMGGLIKIIEFMAKNKCKLSDLVDEIPVIYMNKLEVECPWNAKGKVIREIIQEHGNDMIETTEGVKIYKNGGWVLILPDAELPICRIISESYSEEFAEELGTAYADKIRKISKT